MRAHGATVATCSLPLLRAKMKEPVAWEAEVFEGWMVTLFPSSEARTSKTGQQDVTLQIGGTCPARTWLAAVCHLLHKTPRRDKSDPRLLPLDQRAYSGLFTFATARALLPRATLHGLRHGGASTDGIQGLSDLALQEHGGEKAQEVPAAFCVVGGG